MPGSARRAGHCRKSGPESDVVARFDGAGRYVAQLAVLPLRGVEGGRAAGVRDLWGQVEQRDRLQLLVADVLLFEFAEPRQTCNKPVNQSYKDL